SRPRSLYLQVSQAHVSWNQTWSPCSTPLSCSASEASEGSTRCPCMTAVFLAAPSPPSPPAIKPWTPNKAAHRLDAYLQRRARSWTWVWRLALDSQTGESTAAPACHLVAQVMVECALGVPLCLTRHPCVSQRIRKLDTSPSY
ncbi:hypothetical protein PTTG_29084, partial [Puccinia triticina 1-1 BBBD Race 1]